ncbi:MAG: DEAD/DEAH box helicase, partial [Gemmatimonadales bacterium]
MLSPELEALFELRGWNPFPYQRKVFTAYAEGRSGLVHAATGTGKTWAVWLPVVEEGLREAAEGSGPSGRKTRRSAAPLRALWITPLRALAADTEAAMRIPLEASGLHWTLEQRTGDTAASRRARQRERLPTTLITTPESLSLLLARDDAAQLFDDLRMIVVDEWHELMASKRGVQVELALARLRRWRPALRTWGLSATLGNITVAANALGGLDASGAPRPVMLVKGNVRREVVIDAVIPVRIDRFPWAGHLGTTLVDDVAAIVRANTTTLVFTNTRSQTELWYRAILERCPDLAPEIGLHHGSVSRAHRAVVEDRLRDGSLRAVICTSSLDLGVDFSPVDRVVQIGSPKGIARLLQRAGRSGHSPGRVSRITCVPTHAFELVEFAAVRAAAEAGLMESREGIDAPLDVLAQHLVTCAMGGGFVGDELLAEVRTAWAYRNLAAVEWNWTLDFVAHGGTALRAYPEYNKLALDGDGVWHPADPQVSRRHRMSIGTIVSDASVTVRYLTGGVLGSVEESFVSRMRPGDRFLFAGRPLEFVRARDMVVYVRRSKNKTGSVAR